MSKEGISNKDRFDRMSVDIGTSLINLQMMITDFIIELLLQSDSLSYDLDLSIPHQFTEEFVVVKINGISYKPDLDELIVHSEEPLKWGELNIIAQDLIATHIHIAFTSQHFFGELS